MAMGGTTINDPVPMLILELRQPFATILLVDLVPHSGNQEDLGKGVVST